MFEYRISSKLNQWPKVAVESWLKQFLKLVTVEEGFGVDFFDAVEFIEGLIFGFQFQRKYPADEIRVQHKRLSGPVFVGCHSGLGLEEFVE